mmetsp:Transcript_15289/g.32418  ORF Transcript_15289/g.32418 Transcript_15289/m.32418 type:complete len:91 (+) Transcript_15289:176-448(+)
MICPKLTQMRRLFARSKKVAHHGIIFGAILHGHGGCDTETRAVHEHLPQSHRVHVVKLHPNGLTQQLDFQSKPSCKGQAHRRRDGYKSTI